MPIRHSHTPAAIVDDSLHESDGGLIAVVPDAAPRSVDSLTVWSERYQQLAVAGLRSDEVAKKIALQLGRFISFYTEAYDHDRLSACLVSAEEQVDHAPK